MASSAASRTAGHGTPAFSHRSERASAGELGGPMPVCTNEHAVEFPELDPREPITVEKAAVCDTPLMSSRTTQESITKTAEMLEAYNIYAVTDGEPEVLKVWRKAIPTRVIPATDFEGKEAPELDDLRERYAAGEFEVFAEIAPQYSGRSAAADAFDRYFALAEELDICRCGRDQEFTNPHCEQRQSPQSTAVAAVGRHTPRSERRRPPGGGRTFG